MVKNLISVIIPYQDPAPYLDATLNSLKKQTIFQDLEIIKIKDDGRGVAATRNRGLEQARGEFIYFLDSDDLLVESNVLEKAKDILNNNSELDFVYGDLYLGDDKANKIKYYTSPKYHEKNLVDFLKIGGMVMLGPMLMRNNCAVRFDESIIVNSDIDYILKRTFQKKAEYINMPFIIYRQHKGSLIHKKESKKADNIIKSIDIYKKFIIKYLNFNNNSSVYKIIIAQQSLIRAHMLLTLYFKKPAFEIWLDSFKYFPYNIRLKFFRVILEIILPKFIGKSIRTHRDKPVGE